MVEEDLLGEGEGPAEALAAEGDAGAELGVDRLDPGERCGRRNRHDRVLTYDWVGAMARLGGRLVIGAVDGSPTNAGGIEPLTEG